MTLLTVWPDDQPGHVLLRTEDTATITAELGRAGAGFVRWPLAGLASGAGEAEVLAHFRDRIDARTAGPGYHAVELLVAETGPVERTSNGDEDRFFVSGSAVWYLRAGRQVLALLCEPGDLLTIPAHTRHWHDGGPRPDHVTIRVRHPAAAAPARFPEPVVPADFPGFGALVAERRTSWPALSH
ncbi:cupin domain-containing protein [Amycolatopsis jiangsuensis]|uniref:1,2-dihydroxy-3-keto-5-methylthiopentene dioxygenase n=1 Tax=Amycolatopsis jiangsuensis TaxID=1181879 RepID=A0A840IQ65_9PSEU|nr:cupin [Amycolatopsis jiangsuensis]MBB4684681.1 1,2-dihydroxy-3-keto-5-methylthiopentene dioxygenase [Amycolatopsis jiangsuensis]